MISRVNAAIEDIETIIEPLPWVDITAKPNLISQDEPSGIVWQSKNVNSCIIKDEEDNQIGSGTEGVVTVSLTTTTTYTITCTGEEGTVSDSVTVTVS